jgi:hypothetical protein
MSWKILICKAKPNPTGKDRAFGSPRQEQLLGEWVDLQNTGDTPVSLSRLTLCHMEFSSQGVPHDNSTPYWTGKPEEMLSPGQIARVHTGKSVYANYMAYEDKQGVSLHSFAEEGNFVLNNDYGDIISIWWKDKDNKWQKEDIASYDPNPPEGAILKRSGNKLIPSSAFDFLSRSA